MMVPANTDLVLMGLDLEREIRLIQQETTLKKALLTETRQNLQTATTNLQDTKTQLSTSKTECQELKAQLQVRIKATQKLEEENTYLRDSMAKLTAQIQSYMTERDGLMDRCRKAEEDLTTANDKAAKLTSELDGVTASKEMCHIIQTQNRETIQEIIRNQALLSKEQSRIERCRTEALAFTQEISKQTQTQAEFVKQANEHVSSMEDKIHHLVAALEEVTMERDQLLQIPTKPISDTEDNYLEEWKTFQQVMKGRLDGVLEENRLLLVEIDLIRKQNEKCRQSGDHVGNSRPTL